VSNVLLDVNEATFDEEVKSATIPVIVEFWAEWCPPCQVMAPMLRSLAADYDGRLRVITINSDEHPGLARRFDLVSVPTLLVFVDGEPRARFVGARGRSRLLQDMADVISL
jgi:thioredoxin 1